MIRKSTLGQQIVGPIGFPAGQGAFTQPFSGMFPVGVPAGGICPSGYLPAPSAIVPGGYTCMRAPGSYTTPVYMSGRR